MLRETIALVVLSTSVVALSGAKGLLVVGHSERSAKREVEESAPPRTLQIDGLDYAFRVPEHVKAGLTTITFVNRGKVRHEFNLNLLRPGATPEQVMAALKAGTTTRDFIEASGGVLFAEPGAPAGAAIATDLLAGRTYVLICIFRDKKGAPQHHQIGMFGILRPEGNASAASALTADTIVATDYAFTYPRTLSPGRHRFVFVNRGTQRHEVNMTRLKPGATLANVVAVDKAGGDVDSLFDSGIGVLHSYGKQAPVGALDVDLLPGREYFMECGFTDGDKKPPHYTLGMFGSIHVLPASAKK